MFDKKVFCDRLARQLADFGMEESGKWSIAPSVFISKVRKEGSSRWNFFFYYDITQTVFRESAQMHRNVQLILTGLHEEKLTEEGSENVRIFYFSDSVLPEPVEGDENVAINFASQILKKVDGGEIEWFDKAHAA